MQKKLHTLSLSHCPSLGPTPVWGSDFRGPCQNPCPYLQLEPVWCRLLDELVVWLTLGPHTWQRGLWKVSQQSSGSAAWLWNTCPILQRAPPYTLQDTVCEAEVRGSGFTGIGDNNQITLCGKSWRRWQAWRWQCIARDIALVWLPFWVP